MEKKSFSIGYAIAFLLLGEVVAYTAITLFDSKSADVSNTPGHTFFVDLTGAPEGMELVPGDMQTLSPSVHNGSTIDYIYAFVCCVRGSERRGYEIHGDWAWDRNEHQQDRKYRRLGRL